MPRVKRKVIDYDSADDMFRRSESPEEQWEEDGDWELEIVGEEVDYWGDVRYVCGLYRTSYA